MIVNKEVSNNEKSLTVRPKKVVAVPYRVWSITRGSNCKALTGKILLFWIRSCLREVVEHGGSTAHVNRA